MTTISTEIPQVLMSFMFNSVTHRKTAERMLQFWADINTRLFDSIFPVEDMPVVSFMPMQKSGADGIFYQSHKSGVGFPSMTLCQSILNGRHPSFNAGKAYKEGRIRYLEDVFLHEMIHHFVEDYSYLAGDIWIDLLKKDGERMVEIGNAGAGIRAVAAQAHGLVFCHKANQIAGILGLSPVRVATTAEVVRAAKEGVHVKADGKDATPLCDYFPDNVRPEDYYLGCRNTGTA